jgi:muconolactone delta-isomerase
MQFLVTIKSRDAVPPEMTVSLIEATQAWMAEHRASGKLQSIWAFAGMIAGAAVFEVDSHDEFDALMSGFPFGGSSTIEVFALSDIDKSLASGKAALEQMIAMQGGQ